MSNYSNVDVYFKPWGREYILFQNKNVSIWHLKIDKNYQTSLHCHPNKKTGLLLLSGGAKVSFLGGKYENLLAGDKITLRQGVFHRTLAMCHDTRLIEIETPIDKADLIRLSDDYNRETSYTKEKVVKGSNQVINDKEYCNIKIGDCFLFYSDYDSIAGDIDEFSSVIFVNGGLRINDSLIAGPGDILSVSNHNILVSNDKVKVIEETEVICVKRQC